MVPSRLMPVLILAGLGIAYAVFFAMHPGIDLTLTAHAWNREQGFFLKDEWWARSIYKHIIPWITRLSIAGGVILLISNYFRKNKPLWLSNRQVIYILLALAIGPGLVVNTLFKDNWGRARPIKVQEFGGASTFTEPFVMSDQCEKNCSFVAGHPSVAFFLTAFALLIAHRKARVAAYSAAVLFGLFVGYVRIVQGGHFFSDVIFSGIFTLLVVHILYLVMFGLKETPPRAEPAGRTD